MKNFLRSKKFLIFISIVIFSFVNLTNIYPCASGYLDEIYDSLTFFEQKVVGDPLFDKFYVNYDGAFSQFIPYVYNNDDISDENKKEWLEYFKASKITINQKDLEDILFNGKDISKSSNSIDTDTKNYLSLMNIINKKFEQLQNDTEYGNWEISLKPGDNSWFSKYLKQSLQYASDKSINDFLKLHYAFQALRLSVFLGDNKNAQNIFDTLIAPVKGSSLTKYRALSYKARALYKSGDINGAVKIYLDVFDQYPLLMKSSLNSIKFMNISTLQWENLISSLSNNAKKQNASFVQFLLTQRDYSVKSIKKILDFAIKGSKPEIALVIAIQNIEKYNMGNEHLLFLIDVNDNKKINYQSLSKQQKNIINVLRKKDSYKDLINFCEKSSKIEGIRQPALWAIAGAYLSLLEGNTDNAQVLYQQAVDFKTKNEVLKNQIHLIGTLIKFQKEKYTFSIECQDMVTEDINWASTLKKSDNNTGIYHSLCILTAKKYLTINDLPKAILSLSMNKDYDWSKNLGTWMEWTKTLREDNVKYLLDTIIDDNKLQILESLLKYSAKEPLIQLIVKDSVLTEDDIIYLRGIKELRKENYEKSYNHFKRISSSYFKDTNSFYTTKKGISLIQNKTIYFSKSNSELDPKIKTEEYGILKFSEMMFNLQKEKENLEKQKSPKLINNYFTFGLIYQSMSDESGFPEISIRKKLSWGFDGWNWKYTESTNPITLTFPLYIPGITDSMNKSEKDIYFDTQNFIKAENYYKKVINLNTDKELSAKCCILINTARNNYLYFADEENGIDSINFKTLDKQRFEYFYTLNKQYKDTQFYKEFIKECPLIEKFQ